MALSASLPATEAVIAENNALAVASHVPEHEPQPPSHNGAEQESAQAPDAAAEAYELRHVHAVYACIVDHFSATRHKPWPLVSSFLAEQAPGSVGLDLGCGNGKYLGINPDVWLVGSDRSAELVALAMTLAKERANAGRTRGVGAGGGEDLGRDSGRGRVQVKEKDKAVTDGAQPAKPQRVTEQTEPAGGGASVDALVADGLDLPFRGGRADFAICIAVLHHFSTRQRRVDAIRAVLETLRSGGRVLLYVWALEQGASRRGWNEGGDQDLLVPWVVQENKKKQKKSKGRRSRDEFAGQKEIEGEKACGVGEGEAAGEKEKQTYQRYYHLYRKGELEEEVLEAEGSVLEGGYEKDNWWVVASRWT